MGLFDGIFKNRKVNKALEGSVKYYDLTAYQPTFKSFNGQIYESAMVRSAIDARARYISQMSLEFHGSAKPELQNAMKHQPNEWQTYSQFLYRTIAVLDTYNTVIIVPIYDSNTKIIGIYPVQPSEAEIVENSRGIKLIKYRFGGAKKIGASFLDESVILTKHQFKSDFFGSDNSPLIPSINVLNLQEQGMAELVQQSGIIAYTAQVTNFTMDEDLEDRRAEFEKKQLKGAKKKSLLLFPNTFSNVQRVKCSQELIDNVQIENIKLNVMRYFGVSEAILENKASDEQINAFYEQSLKPIITQLEQGLNKALFTSRELSNGSYIKLTKEPSKAERERLAKLLSDRGALKIDELRALFGYEALPDGLGEMLTIRGEYKDLSELKEHAEE